MKSLARLLREPLLHFLLLGGLLFLLYSAISGPAPTPRDTIVVGPERIEQLKVGFQRTWLRPPSEAELSALVEDFVREEVYYREALALGLDRDDTVIRRRLRQKMEFLTDTGVDALQPAAGELEAYLAANEQTYRVAPRLALRQIFLGEQPTPKRVAETLSALRSEAPADPAELGERTLLPAQLPLSTVDDIDGLFGKGFFDRLAALPMQTWSGPVESAYGVHLVRIEQSLPGRSPQLEEVRDRVLRDWRALKSRELREQLYARLRERYQVRLPDDTTPPTQTQTQASR